MNKWNKAYILWRIQRETHTHTETVQSRVCVCTVKSLSIYTYHVSETYMLYRLLPIFSSWTHSIVPSRERENRILSGSIFTGTIRKYFCDPWFRHVMNWTTTNKCPRWENSRYLTIDFRLLRNSNITAHNYLACALHNCNKAVSIS